MTDAPGRRLGLTAGSLVAALAGLIGWVEVHHRRPLSWDVALHAAALHHRTPALTAAALLRATGPAATPARSDPLGPQRPEQQPEGGQL